MPTGNPSDAPRPHNATPTSANHVTRRQHEQHRPGDTDDGDRAHDGNPPVAVEQSGPEPPADGHRCQEHGEGQGADCFGSVVIVDDRHGDPVVGHTLGEREREHEDTDEQGAGLAPGRERASSTDRDGGIRRTGCHAARVVRCHHGVVVVVLGEES